MRITKKTLAIDGFDIQQISVDDQVINVYGALNTNPDLCPSCNIKTELGVLGSRVTKIVDKPYKSHHVTLHVDLLRFICKSCKTTFMQTIPFRYYEVRMTKRAAQYIIDQYLAARPLDEIISGLGISTTTYNAVVKAYASELNQINALGETIELIIIHTGSAVYGRVTMVDMLDGKSIMTVLSKSADDLIPIIDSAPKLTAIYTSNLNSEFIFELAKHYGQLIVCDPAPEREQFYSDCLKPKIREIRHAHPEFIPIMRKCLPTFQRDEAKWSSTDKQTVEQWQAMAQPLFDLSKLSQQLYESLRSTDPKDINKWVCAAKRFFKSEIKWFDDLKAKSEFIARYNALKEPKKRVIANYIDSIT